jgi:hypothetical protein
LEQTLNGKCAYCESLISLSSPVILDRFRPTQDAVGLDGQFAEDHYWWLAYEWFNLYSCCADCNRLKATRFPVGAARRAPVHARRSQLNDRARFRDGS